MKKYVILILTVVTVGLLGYGVVSQLDLFEKKGNDMEQLQNNNIATEIEEEVIDTKPKQQVFLNSTELQKVVNTRDPFAIAPVVKNETDRKEKEYAQLKARIENRVKELEMQQALANGEEYKPEEKPFEELLKEEIEKIINQKETVAEKEESGLKVENPTKDKTIVTIADKYAKQYSVDRELVLAIIGSKTASDSKFEIKNPDGTFSRGLMQISTDTAKWTSREVGLKYRDKIEFDNDANIKMGTYYLNYLKKQHNDVHYILTAYYVGPGGAEKIKKSTGSYKSSYSNVILKRMK